MSPKPPFLVQLIQLWSQSKFKVLHSMLRFSRRFWYLPSKYRRCRNTCVVSSRSSLPVHKADRYRTCNSLSKVLRAKASITQLGCCLPFCNLLISDSSCYRDIHLSFLYGQPQILQTFWQLLWILDSQAVHLRENLIFILQQRSKIKFMVLQDTLNMQTE